MWYESSSASVRGTISFWMPINIPLYGYAIIELILYSWVFGVFPFAVKVNFMCQLDCAKGCLDLGVSISVLPEDIIWLSKVDCPPQCGWIFPNLLRADGGAICSCLCLPAGAETSHFISSRLIFSGSWTGSYTISSFGSQAFSFWLNYTTSFPGSTISKGRLWDFSASVILSQFLIIHTYVHYIYIDDMYIYIYHIYTYILYFYMYEIHRYILWRKICIYLLGKFWVVADAVGICCTKQVNCLVYQGSPTPGI